MPEPGLGDIHIDTALTDISVAHFQGMAPNNRVATSVFPIVPSPRQSNKYYKYVKDDLLRTDARKRAPGTEAPVRDYGVSNDSFFCDVFSIAIDISEQQRANADAALDPEGDAARVLVDDITLRQEKDFSTVAFTTAQWATKTTTTDIFNSTGIFPVIAAAHKNIESRTGYKANTLVMTADCWWDGLYNNADIVSRLPNDSLKIVTTQFVASLFNVDRVFVVNAVEASGDENSTGVSTNYIATNKALMCYVPATPGLRVPSAGYTFAWSGLLGAGDLGLRTLRHDMAWKDAMPRVQVDAAYDFKVTSTDLGHLFENPL